MPNEEKKYTVDDILDEYSSKISDPEPDLVSSDEEIIIEELTEEISAGSEQEKAEEEIFADDNTDDTEIVEEILEEDASAAADADISLDPDEISENEGVSEISEWAEAGVAEKLENIADTGETALFSVPETSDDEEEAAETQESSDAEESAESEETRSDETNPTEDISGEISDVNESFMKKLLHGAFPCKGDSIGEIIRKIIFLVAIIVFIGAGIMLVSTLVQSSNALADKEEVQSVITTTVATTIDSDGNVITVAPTEEEIAEHNFNVAEHFKSINEDYKGYLEVAGCDIYEPVMQGDDNNYYLTHNYYGGTNKAGTVFMDYRCKVGEDYVSPNIVLYGHNQEDGTMFGNLKDYKNNVEFYSENPVVKFSTEYETGEYLIYGFFVTNVLAKQDSNGEVFHYHDYIETLSDEDTFNWYMDEIRERNQIVSPVDVQYGDKLLCLSTCSNEFSDSRFVVFARKLREGESADDYDFSEAYLNPNAKGVDWKAIMSGETTTVSVETDENGNPIETTAPVETDEDGNPIETTAPVETDEDGNPIETEETTKKKKKKTTTQASETEEESSASEEASEESESSETSETTAKTTRPTGPTGPTGTTTVRTETAAEESVQSTSEPAETEVPESAADNADQPTETAADV
ncbi:MAG: class B sortase [Oscillospiraceae bacterium]